jgi:hypothetical protein
MPKTWQQKPFKMPEKAAAGKYYEKIFVNCWYNILPVSLLPHYWLRTKAAGNGPGHSCAAPGRAALP